MMVEGWKKAKFKDYVFFQEGPGLTSNLFREEGMPFINIRCIDDGKILKKKCQKIDKKIADKIYQQFYLEENDLIISSSGSLGKKSFVKKKDLPLMLNTSTIRLKPLDENKLDKYFLSYFIETKYFEEQILFLTTGSAQKNFGPTHLEKIDILFPESLKEQQKIADILTKVDETIEATENIIAKDERIKKGLMQDLFSKGIDENGNLRSEETHEFKDSELGRIPKDWDVDTISPNFAEITTGNKDTQDRNDRGLYPFFVRSNTIERINSYSYDGEAILTSGDGVGVGKIYHYVNCKFDFHQRVYMLYNFKKDISAKYLFYYFREHFYDEVAKYSAKTTVDSVRLHMIADMLVPKPKPDEQKQIASILSSIDSKIQKEKQELNKLKSIKEGLMQDLLTGKVRVNHLLEAVA